MTPIASSPSDRAPSSWAILLWAILASLGLLLVAEFARGTPCWGVLLMVPILAYPLWLSLRESFVFNRRLLLAGVTPDGCLTRRWFWSGQLGVILRIPQALVMAALLLTLTLRLDAQQWAILMGDALVFALLYRVLERRSASQVHPRVRGIVVRGWPLRWINLGLLTLAFFVLSFFVLGMPDLRQASWQIVAEQAFETGRAGIVCSWIGWLAGSLEALDQGSWALAQRYIPELPLAEWRLAAWLLLLLQLGLLALLFTRLLLGVLTLVETWQLRAESLTGESLAAKTFVLTILALALLSLYPALRLRDLDPSQFRMPAQELLAWIDPCHAEMEQNAAIQARLDVELTTERDRLIQEVEQRIDKEVERFFVPVVAGVENYLDWYFTVMGEYARLLALVTGDFPQRMAEQLDTHLFVATDFHAQVETLDRELLEETRAQLGALSQSFQERIEAPAQRHPCLRISPHEAPLTPLRGEAWRTGAAGASGVVAGVATAALSKKVAASVVAKVGTQKTVQAAVTLAAQLAAKKGGGTLAAAAGAAALCAATGPAAIACGLAAGGVTWLTIDKAAIEISEVVSRDAMRTEILVVVTTGKEQLKRALRQRHATLVARQTEELQTTVDGLFIPARDGW